VSPTATLQRVTIARRYNGPPESANGGYACGVAARLVDGPAEVSLRRPVPLDTPLDAERHDDGRVTVTLDGELLATAEPTLPLDLEPPYRPSLAEARAAMREGAHTPPCFGHCFVCSATRADGLGVAFGALGGHPGLTAAVLEHDEPLTDELVWAALDCPSYTPAIWDAPPSLLARMRAEILAPVPDGEPLVVVGWPLRTEGRKHESATALLDVQGRMLARAEALWIRPRRA
jgi:hypothetical protein